jgi:hypothetical protein
VKKYFKYGGPQLLPALLVAVLGGITLFLSEVTWLEVIGASVLLIGAALIIANIATPEFLERDLGDD